jgi:hypothetical protein
MLGRSWNKKEGSPDNNCRTESNGHKQKKEQRELTQVQRLRVARLLKRWTRKHKFEARSQDPFLEDPGR